MNNGRRIRIPYLTKTAIEEKAQEFLHDNYDGAFPVDVDEVCDGLNINIIYIPNLKLILSADAFITGDFNTIYADEGCADITKNDCRYRFSVAHELGHKVLHAPYYPTDIHDIATYCSCMDCFDNSHAEVQANTFAGVLLCPSSEIRKLSKEVFGCELEEAIPRCNQTEMGDFLVKMCSKFGISSQAALIRLRYVLGDDILRAFL